MGRTGPEAAGWRRREAGTPSPRVRGRPPEQDQRASASSDPAALSTTDVARGRCGRRAHPRQREAPSAPARALLSGAPTEGPSARGPRTNGSHAGRRAEHAEPAPGGTAASASGSPAHAESRAGASPRIVAADTGFPPRPAVTAAADKRDGATSGAATGGACGCTCGRLLGPVAPAPAPAGEAERQRIDVAVRIRGEADAEMDIRLRPLGLAARADSANDVALADLSSDGSPNRSQVDERDRPAVLGSDRQGRDPVAGMRPANATTPRVAGMHV